MRIGIKAFDNDKVIFVFMKVHFGIKVAELVSVNYKFRFLAGIQVITLVLQYFCLLQFGKRIEKIRRHTNFFFF